ncbi:hypothetical protein BRD00_01780 [Halobacteriales archaeon QS_8_69_26]|nr:MAG: hypothetical protein BRD00_01780 [Halobacteriales archaeon QS_8_69_26]
MTGPDRSPAVLFEVVLAALVVAVAGVTFTALPQPYPTWPTVGPVPVNPELVVPGVLGAVTVARAVTDPGVGSAAVGAVGTLTLLLAVSSLHTLYAGTGGGVFWGGFVTLLSGVVLVVAVLVRAALASVDLTGVRSRIPGLSGDA